MPRKGRELELLLEKIHSVLDDDAIRIESPCFVTDVDTGQQREVDVGIWKADSDGQDILIAVESRDREGVEDVMWVEQLISKKVSIGASVLYVVTSSSFTAPAQIKALKRGVILRRIDDFDPAALPELLASQSIDIHSIEPTAQSLGAFVQDGLPPGITLEQLRVLDKKTGQYLAYSELVQRLALKPIEDIDRTLHKHGEQTETTIRVTPNEFYAELPSENMAIAPKLLKIEAVDIRIKVKKHVEKIPLTLLRRYQENADDKLLADVLEYAGNASAVIDQQQKLAEWFLNFAEMPSTRFFTRMKFVASDNYNLRAVHLTESLGEKQVP